MTRTREPISALRLARAMEQFDRVGRRANPPSRARMDPSAAVRAALAALGKPARSRLAEALEVVTGAPLPQGLRPGYPVTFSADAVRVGRAGDPGSFTARLAIRSPAEAWEAMATHGLVPAHWLGDPDRYFLTTEAERQGGFHFQWVGERRSGTRWVLRRYDGSHGVSPNMFEVEPEPLDVVFYQANILGSGRYLPAFQADPTSVALAVALGSDADRVATADALVAEVVTRLRPWLSGEETARPVRIAWGFTASEATAAWAPSQPHAGGLDAVSSCCLMANAAAPHPATTRALQEADALTNDASKFSGRWAARADLLWSELARLGAVVGHGHGFAGPPPSLIGTPFSDLKNPIDPLMALWSLGYGLSDTVGPNMRVEVPPLVVPESLDD